MIDQDEQGRLCASRDNRVPPARIKPDSRVESLRMYSDLGAMISASAEARTRPSPAIELFASGDIVHFVDWFTNLGVWPAFTDGAVRRKLLIAPSAAPAGTGAN